MSFRVMLRKEWGELVKTSRWYLIPLLFLILAMLNVLLTKALPEILKAQMSTLPKGTVIHFPLPTGSDALGKALQQFDQMGVIAIILLYMGAIAGERASGVMTTILVKPVSRMSYVGAKLAMALITVSVSFVFSMFVSWYYTEQLFTHGVAFKPFVEGTLTYLPKLLVIISIVLFFSALTKSTLLAGGLSLIVSILMSFLGINHWLNTHAPSALSSMSLQFFNGHNPSVGAPIVSSVIIVVVLFLVSCQLLNRREV